MTKIKKGVICWVLVVFAIVIIGIIMPESTETINSDNQEKLTEDNTNTSASEEEKDTKVEESGLSEKKFKKLLKNYSYEDIIEYYNTDILTEEQRTVFIAEIKKKKIKTIKENIRPFNSTKIIETLKVLDALEGGEEFAELKTIYDAAKAYEIADKNRSAIRDKYGEFIHVGEGEDFYITGYVMKKVKLQKYFTLYNYRQDMFGNYVYEQPIIGCVTFKEAPSQAGVQEIYVTYEKDVTLTDSNGFKNTVPLYLEIDQNDVEASLEISKAYDQKEKQEQIIKTAVGYEEPQ